jgi:hypothetical protein
MADIEQGAKWWIRYVAVPVIGSGVALAIVNALLGASAKPPPANTATPEPRPDPPKPSPSSALPNKVSAASTQEAPAPKPLPSVTQVPTASTRKGPAPGPSPTLKPSLPTPAGSPESPPALPTVAEAPKGFRGDVCAWTKDDRQILGCYSTAEECEDKKELVGDPACIVRPARLYCFLDASPDTTAHNCYSTPKACSSAVVRFGKVGYATALAACTEHE